MFLGLAAFAAITSAVITVAAFPNAPFYTDGRWIKDSAGCAFTYAGVNWPGAADTMLPEGLQYQSVSSIVSKIKSSGFNIIRLTFAIEMIDEIFENDGSDVPIKTAFIDALGVENGTRIFEHVLTNNPRFNENTTRLQVFDAVAEECANQGIYVHLDNHMSKAEWCCSLTDGNGWFGDTYFSVANWTRGLSYMASHAASWPNFVSIGLRNELRPALNNTKVFSTYNWTTWYSNMVLAANAVNAANPDVLIFLGGMNSDTSVGPISRGSNLGGGVAFNKTSFAYVDKLVLELHNYLGIATSCNSLESYLYQLGFDALNSTDPTVVNVMPVVMTEFGYDQDASGVDSIYATCLKSYLPSQQAGWMVWVLAGSYYIRSGIQDYDDTWGILNHDWSDYRNATVFEEGVGAMISASLS